jgi:hypothetical protein
MKTYIILKKPEDSHKVIEAIRKQGDNKQCFDCGEKVIITKLGNYICCNDFWNIRLF